MMKRMRSNSRIMPLRFFLVCVLLVVIQPGNAHQQKSAITRILFNSNSGNLEIMHRFFVHDAEHAAGLIFGEEQDLLESVESRELFSSYVINRFAVTIDNAATPLQLDYVGAEVDGQYLWVYQEIALPADVKGLTIVQVALHDVWPDQSNLVNIERAGQVYSLEFVNPTAEQHIELQQNSAAD